MMKIKVEMTWDKQLTRLRFLALKLCPALRNIMTLLKLNYRKATSSDVSPVRALVLSAYRGEASRDGWTTEADLLSDERIDEAGVLQKITDPHGAVLLAHDDAGLLVSCCELLRRDDNVAYFGMFAVDPKRQAGGIGRQVLTQAEVYAKETWGVGKLEMSVIWTREELISWYVRRGFVKTERTAPFPYEGLVNGKAMRDDLYFVILEKDL